MLARISTTRRPHVSLTLIGLLLAAATTAHAQTPSYSVTDWSIPGGQTGSYTLGYTFTPIHNIVVSALGEWVASGNAIVSSENVGIFNSSGTLLFSSTYNQANATLTSNTLGDGSQFRYVNITSLAPAATRTLLANNTYTMAGTFTNNPYFLGGSNLTPSPDITLSSGGLYNGGDTISGPTPTAPSTPSSANMYSVNFEYGTATSPSATPEPGTWALLGGLTTCGLGLVRRRRRKA